MAKDALRVLGLAYKDVSHVKKYTIEGVEKDMVFVGLAGMIDPPRPEAREALRLCKKAGIKVAMVTGDHKLTAEAIGRNLGLIGAHVKAVDGNDLNKMSDKELYEQSDKIGVYARVSPEHKVKIVQALQKKGYIVAMTGDGVNDAPALKNADIGVSMGLRGTDVAKEAADMILEDDNFATIVKAVGEGRSIYDNIRKFLRFLLTSNIGEVLAIFGAALFGLPLPLLAVQILWMNLLTDGLPAVALAVDPSDPDVMDRAPRDPKEPAIDRDMMYTVALVGIVMAVGTIGVFWWFLKQGTDIVTSRSIAFSTLVMFQMFNVFNSRNPRKSFFKEFFSNKWLLMAVLSSILLHLMVIYVPLFNELFGTAPLTSMNWAYVLVISFTVIVVVELKKLAVRLKKS